MDNSLIEENENEREAEVPAVIVPVKPQSAAENARQTGLAWSAGIVFFSSIVFMLIIGWLADWLLGSAPWGIVGGMVIGSILGFVQFFRLSSQIFGPKKPNSAVRPLMQDDDHQE